MGISGEPFTITEIRWQCHRFLELYTLSQFESAPLCSPVKKALWAGCLREDRGAMKIDQDPMGRAEE